MSSKYFSKENKKKMKNWWVNLNNIKFKQCSINNQFRKNNLSRIHFSLQINKRFCQKNNKKISYLKNLMLTNKILLYGKVWLVNLSNQTANNILNFPILVYRKFKIPIYFNKKVSENKNKFHLCNFRLILIF